MTHVRIRRIREREPKALQIIDLFEPSWILQIIFLEEKHLWKFKFKKLLWLANDYNEIVTAITKKKKKEEAMTKKKREERCSV
jgi:hypothetical protein